MDYDQNSLMGSLVFGCSLIMVTAMGIVNYYHKSELKALANLRLSERRESVMPRKDRVEIFDTRIAPMYRLQLETFEYKVLQRTCLDGVFNSNVDDMDVPLDKVQKTYDLCGWDPTTSSPRPERETSSFPAPQEYQGTRR